MVEIDIVIKMGDTCENQMSMDEARALYNALKPIFSGENESINVDQNFMHYPPGVRSYDGYEAPYTPPVMQPENIQHKSVEQEVEKTISNSTSSPAEDSKVATPSSMPPPNLKVEAARERAAQRTSGCGSRK